MFFRKTKYFLLLLLLWLQVRCRQDFNPPAITTAYNFLVVDGFIDAGNNPTNFKLSRTLMLDDRVPYKPEPGAAVNLEGQTGFIATLQEDSAGSYTGGPFSLRPGDSVRLHIKTTNGKEYYSDFVEANSAPSIDSVGWQRNKAGVSIYVNTHNQDTAATRYYKWKYEQTWMFRAAFTSALKIENGFIVTRPNYDSIYTCWRSSDSHEIIIGSSAALSENVITRQPLLLIPAASWQISVKYSILVKQEVVNKEAYEYLQLLKKVTEQAGSIFDPQPATVNGNIHCANDANEIVLGYVYASSVTEERIFINNSELPDWGYSTDCVSFISRNSADYILIEAGAYFIVNSTPEGLQLTSHSCADCTLRGVHKKPVFWP